MDNKRRGLALIFNQEDFYWKLGLRTRHGTNADSFNLERRYFSMLLKLAYKNLNLELEAQFQ